jgi:hypothetical protein
MKHFIIIIIGIIFWIGVYYIPEYMFMIPVSVFLIYATGFFIHDIGRAIYQTYRENKK